MKRVSKLIIYGLVIVGIAIANSPKLKQSESRIALIEQRLAVTEERIDYTSKKKWTNYISTNPVNIIQNLFGGGGVQRDNIAIAVVPHSILNQTLHVGYI